MFCYKFRDSDVERLVLNATASHRMKTPLKIKNAIKNCRAQTPEWPTPEIETSNFTAATISPLIPGLVREARRVSSICHGLRHGSAEASEKISEKLMWSWSFLRKQHPAWLFGNTVDFFGNMIANQHHNQNHHCHWYQRTDTAATTELKKENQDQIFLMQQFHRSRCFSLKHIVYNRKDCGWACSGPRPFVGNDDWSIFVWNVQIQGTLRHHMTLRRDTVLYCTHFELFSLSWWENFLFSLAGF